MQSASAVPILGSMKTPRTLILSGALVASALGIGAAPALAAPSPVLTPDQIATFETQQAAHRACLEGQGVTLPTRIKFDPLPADEWPMSNTASVTGSWAREMPQESFLQDIVLRWRAQSFAPEDRKSTRLNSSH